MVLLKYDIFIYMLPFGNQKLIMVSPINIRMNTIKILYGSRKT